jgi:hypothetical protein
MLRFPPDFGPDLGSTAPFDRDLEIAVLATDGSYGLVFPCRRILRGWVSLGGSISLTSLASAPFDRNIQVSAIEKGEVPSISWAQTGLLVGQFPRDVSGAFPKYALPTSPRRPQRMAY